MDNSKNVLTLIGVGIGIGVVLTVIAVVILGARPSGLNLGPVEFDFQATATISTNPSDTRGCGGWCEEIGQVPESGTRILKDLAAGHLMFLTGGQFQISGKYCGSDPQQICVLIYEATKAQTVVVDAVIPKNNYIGITDTFSPEEALNEKTSLFWIPPNCINGCKRATVFFFRDGEFIKQEARTP